MKRVWLSLGLALCSFNVWGESSSHLKVEDALKNKTFQEDKSVTDIELKASAGSLSRYSMKFDLSFSGPPVNDLADSEMPNPDGRSRNNKTSLSGYVGLRYRLNPNEAVNMSTGVRWFAPYQNVIGEKIELRRGERRLDTASPQISYDRTASSGALQFRTSVKASPTTDEFYKSRGQVGSLGLEQNLKWNLGQSRWVAGFLTDFSLFVFNRGFEESDQRVSNYFLSLIPGLEYKITDRFNLKTSMAHAFANERRTGTWTTWSPQKLTARAGFGWGITRDIYVNPYVNFFVEKPALNTTSLSMSTVFSIF
ncbi:MAG: hypothetical protein KF799_13645 [Bdellovibrionales bacterium]|nr:hypothetical protein [Bdellovibrionales bacterium]